MAERRIEQTFQATPETLWSKVFFETEYNHKLFVERLHFQRWEVVDRQDTDDGFRQTIEAVPATTDLPRAIRSLMKNGLGYVEEGEYFRSKSLYVLKVTTKSIPDRLDINAQISISPIDEGRSKRVYHAKVSAKIPLGAAMLERRILDDLEKSFVRSTEFTQRWLSDHDLLSSPK